MSRVKFIITIFIFIVISGVIMPFTKAAEKHFLELPSDRIAMMRYKSKIDGSSQPLLIKTPADYSIDKSWPLLVVLHGLGDGPILAPEINSMIQIGPYGRGDKWYTGIGEKDVLESIDFAKKMLPIDEDQIYLAGFSMGGYGTFRLASRFPDIWAACIPVCPRVPEDFKLGNCTNVPFWIHTGSKDLRLPPEPCADLYAKSQKAEIENWLYTQHENMGHSFNINWKDVETWLLKHRRAVIPSKVDFTTDDLGSNLAYWIKINQVIDSKKSTSVKGTIKGKTVDVLIENVSSFTIDFSDQMADNLSINKVIIRNNKKVIYSGKLSEDGMFTYNHKSD